MKLFKPENKISIKFIRFAEEAHSTSEGKLCMNGIFDVISFKEKPYIPKCFLIVSLRGIPNTNHRIKIKFVGDINEHEDQNVNFSETGNAILIVELINIELKYGINRVEVFLKDKLLGFSELLAEKALEK